MGRGGQPPPILLTRGSGMRHVIRLSKTFSDVITHKGIPELGQIVKCNENVVTWMFNDREVYAVLSDAISVVETFHMTWDFEKKYAYSKEERDAAKTAKTTLRNVINAKSIPKPVP